MKLIIPLLFIIASSTASCVLFLFPTPSKSHMIITYAVSTALAERGHEVTVISPFPLNREVKNHREIIMPIPEKVHKVFEDIVQGKNSLYKMILPIIDAFFIAAKEIPKMEEFKELLNEKFDLIVIGAIFNNFLLGYGDHFKCPTAVLSVQKHMFLSDVLVGNPMESHSVPHPQVLVKEWNFITRVNNLLVNAIFYLMNLYIDHLQKEVHNEMFPSEKYRSYEASMQNISITLVNDHFSDGHPRPLVPASIEIRGIQVKDKPDKLPEDLQKFLDDAPHGVILFSLGTNVKASDLSEEKLNIFLNTFRKIKQKVIMKWDTNYENLPKNILIKKWLPQDDILAHPNLKLFISHCGLGGIVESKFHGIPILGLPIFGDQLKNAENEVHEGWMKQLDFISLTEKEFHDAVLEMIESETYSSIAKHSSKLLRDRPLTAKETAVYWLEYVMRHHGAPHLQYPSIRLNFFQRNSLDVITFLILSLYIFIKISELTIKLIYRNIFKRKLKKN